MKNVFTTGQGDNIVHDPSSSTSKSSFHGTGISIIQHPTSTEPLQPAPSLLVNGVTQGKRSISNLPANYSTIHPAALYNKKPKVPTITGAVHTPKQDLTPVLEDELPWMEYVKNNIEEDITVTKDSNLSWAAYHAAQQTKSTKPCTVSALLPLFTEKSGSVAMIKHTMDVVRNTTNHINPGQTPVLTLDQPLFAIAKLIQWNFPQTYGEGMYIIMFGGLHIEMMATKLAGQWLEDSGWTAALEAAEVATEGTADACTKASHLTKSRHAHQVTAAALYVLLQKAYQKYSQEWNPPAIFMGFDEWCQQMASEQPQFLYWFRTLELELTILKLVKSFREANFKSYIKSLAHLMPWVLNHTNYARWLSVHVRDMCSLEELHPDIYQEFMAGSFVAHKTDQHFSNISLDQFHEQMNASVKGDGGIIGITENPQALRRWEVAGPEVARMIEEFEKLPGIPDTSATGRHHEQMKHVQSKF